MFSKCRHFFIKISIGLFFLCQPSALLAETVHVAVASNFVQTMQQIARKFETQTGHTLLLSAGSSGKHYAQIKNGAPYDVFFSADAERPEKLEQEGLTLLNSRFTYAIGRLVLWGKDSSLIQKKHAVFNDIRVSRIAIANPRLAPYGKAAQQALTSLGAWGQVNDKLVRGENVNQAYQFSASGNAQIALLSHAQVHHAGKIDFWLLPQQLHQPIVQQAVILNDSLAAQALFDFMRSDQALEFITLQGYDAP